MTTPTPPTRAIAWFDIPVHDLDRAVRFYEAMLDTKLERQTFGGVPIAVFGHDSAYAGGSLVQDPHGSKPARAGTVIYLNGGESVAAALGRAKRAGGDVDGPVFELPREIGYVGFVLDTEGNRVGLHAPGR